MSYSTTFRDHLAHPRNVGEISNATIVTEETNPVCGDRLRLSLVVKDGTIESARYLAYGCPPTLVCGSVLTELIKGKPLTEVEGLKKEDLVNAVGGLPSRKQHAAALAMEALANALKTAESLTGRRSDCSRTSSGI